MTKLHFIPTHRASSVDADFDVMAVQQNDEVWCYTAYECDAEVEEPALVCDVREMPRAGIVAEDGRVHVKGKPVRGWCLKRLTAVLDFVPNGPGLTARELDDRTVADDPPEHEPGDVLPDDEAIEVPPAKKRSRKRIEIIADVAEKTNKIARKKKGAVVPPPILDPDVMTADERIVRAIEEDDGVASELAVDGPATPTTIAQALSAGTFAKMTLVNAAIFVLKASPDPMTVKQIAACIQARDLVEHASKDFVGTLGARLHERPQCFAKVAPATYTIAGPDVVPMPPRERRAREKLEPTTRLSLTDARALVEKGPQAIDALLKLQSFVAEHAP